MYLEHFADLLYRCLFGFVPPVKVQKAHKVECLASRLSIQWKMISAKGCTVATWAKATK